MLLLALTAVFLVAGGGVYTIQFDSLLYLDKDVDGILRPRELDRNLSYCYQLTWLGPDYDEENFTPYENKSCADKFASSKPMPMCVDPMVATNNGTPPDLGWLADNKPKQAFCKLSQGNVCAKYSFIFNGNVQNVTRLCTKVTVDDVNMRSGCIQDTRGRYTTEICACTTEPGDTPCNSCPIISLNNLLIIHCLITLFVIKYIL